jgi:hypothetical protein
MMMMVIVALDFVRPAEESARGPRLSTPRAGWEGRTAPTLDENEGGAEGRLPRPVPFRLDRRENSFSWSFVPFSYTLEDSKLHCHGSSALSRISGGEV